MGVYAIKPYTKILAWLVATVLVYLNVKLVAETVIGVFGEEGHSFLKILTGTGALIFLWLFVMMTILPVINKQKKHKNIRLHGEEKSLRNLSVPVTHRIAVALDFSYLDEKLIAYALNQGNKDATYVLMHVVETASANYFGASADDYETRDDHQRLEDYALQLKNLGYNITIALGYQNRINEILRIVKQENADMIIMGAHRHGGIKDYVYGATVDQVRHRVSIPVLIVS